MLARLTSFIGLYGVGFSSMIFGLIVFVAGVAADLVMLFVFDLPIADAIIVIPAAGMAGLVSAIVIYPFGRAATQLEDKEQKLRDMQADLRESERRFRDFADAASDWYWEMDADLRFTYFSSKVEEVTGVPVDFHIGKTREELAGEDAKTPKWRAHLDDLKAHRPFKDFRFARLGHDGRVQHVSSSGKPISGIYGNFAGYRGIGSDITAEVEAERNVRNSQERLAAAIDGLSELFVLWDANDRLIVCNERFREINQDIIEATHPGTSFADHARMVMENGLIPGAKGREEEWLADRIARHANPTGPFELERQDGRWLLINEQRMPDGTTATISTDISELKKAEETIRKSEQRLRDFASIAADWFWEQDVDLRFTYFSTDNESILGLAAADHIGKTRRESVPVEENEATLAVCEAACAARQPFSDLRFCRVRPDGSKFHMSISGNPIFDDQGGFIGYRGVGRDVSNIVFTEEDNTQAE